MATTWNTSRTKQNFLAKARQRHPPLCVSRRSKSTPSVFLRVAFLILLASSVIATASKGQDEGPLVRGQDEEVLADEGSDGRGRLESVSADGVDPIQLLRDFAESGDKDFEVRTEPEGKRKWSNNEYLRVWGKRNGLRKLSEQDPTRESTQKEMEGNDGPLDRDHVLILLGLRRSDVHGSPTLAQFRNVARKSGTEFQIVDERDLGPSFLGMAAAAGIHRPDEARPKRKWERNSLRIWGKRGDRLMYTNMRRRKWENLPLRVWGK